MSITPIKAVLRSSWFLLAAAVALAAGSANADQHRAVQLTPGPLPNTSFSGFGEAVSTAGDVNGDGIDDLIVSEPLSVNRGRVHVYYGSRNDQFNSQGGSVGIPDWQAIGNARGFGNALASGDFNCDNIDDVVVGAYDAAADEPREGHVYVYYGSDTGLKVEVEGEPKPDWRAESDIAGAQLGWSVSSAGDVNKDGCDDLLVGSNISSGLAVLFLGSDNGLPDAEPAGNPDGVARSAEGDFSWQVSGAGRLGLSVAGIGDVNGDAVDDILVGSADKNIYIYYGVEGAGAVPNLSPDWQASHLDFGFGRRVAKGGDVNGDGTADFIVGQPRSDHGTVHLYFGIAKTETTDGGPRTDNMSDWHYTPDERFSAHTDISFASTISTAGDLNGDGYDDMIVGWPSYLDSVNQSARRGRAYIFYGGDSGPAASPSEIVDGPQENGRFGSSVSAGDFDGDMQSDFVISAPHYAIDLGSTGLTTHSGIGTVFAYLSTSAPARITIDPPQSYTKVHVTSEDGTSKTSFFTVVLDRQPDANVTIDITSNNENEGLASPAGLSFTTSDWDQPQTVNITAVDDTLDDGTVEYTLSFAVSGDAAYDGVSVADVTIRNEDDDASIIVVDPLIELVTTEDGGSATFTVQLDAQPAVGTSVIIDLTSTNPDEGTLSHDSLTFTQAKVPQTVTVTGEDDMPPTLDGNIPYTIITAPAVSDDPAYNNLNAADVEVTNHDNELKMTTKLIEGDQSGSLFGRSLNPAGDINGDGFADIIVGAPNHNSRKGRASVYFGGPQGFSSTTWVAEVDQDGAEFGGAVAAAGDVNGDGFADIIIGAHKYNGGEDKEGRVFVYYGSASGLPATPSWMAEIDQKGANFGASVSSAGDVNRDGFDDILVGADNYYSADFPDPGARFPSSIKEGAAFLFYGSKDGLSDKDQDGIARLAEDEVDNDVAWQGDTGGSSGTLSIHYGQALGSAGDVNCDGYADIIIAAPKYHHFPSFFGLLGRVWVYYGGKDGLRDDGNADWTMLGAQLSSSFGSSVAGAGNVNGDTNGEYSCDDIVIGSDSFESTGPSISLSAENNEGRVYLYYGSPTGLTSEPWTDENNQANSKLGFSSAAAGDLNNDGFADIIAGANNYNGGEAREGRIYIYFGSDGGLGKYPVTREIDRANALFGTAVAGVGDVDGDGNDDFMVGATLFNGKGAAFLYLSDQAGVKVHPVDGLETSELSGSDSFSVVLTDKPTAVVTIDLSTSNPTEGTLDHASLQFSQTNWSTPQTVTVTGVNDEGAIDGDVPYVIVTAAAESADGRYNGMDVDDISVLNRDDEQPTVSIVASDDEASESGADNGTFTVSRTGETPSPLLVFYTVGGTANNGLDYQNLSGSVTIAAGSSSADITLTPLPDGIVDVSETVILTLGVEERYAVGASDSASVTITDVTTNGITISPTSGLVTTEQGGVDTFTVVLTSLPMADVTIGFASDTPAEGHTLVSSVTFTGDNWDLPQTVTVAGQDDGITIDTEDKEYTILTTVTSVDSAYAALDPDDVIVNNRDDDALPLVTLIATRSVVLPGSNVALNGAVFEGEGIPFRVSRTGDTSSNLTVNYTVISGGTARGGVVIGDLIVPSDSDYVTPSGTVTIQSGQSWAEINVSTIADIHSEGVETLALSLSDNASYIVGSPRADSAMIRDRGATLQTPVSFGPDQMVAENTMVSVAVVKRDAKSPINISYSVAGTARNTAPEADHGAQDGDILVNETGTTGYITFITLDDDISEGDETIVFTMESFSPAQGNPRRVGVFGNKTTHTVTITAANLHPAVSLVALQGTNQPTHLVVANGGDVTIRASVADPNPGDTHDYDWSLSHNSLVDLVNSDEATFVFNPNGLASGFYKARVTVTDNGNPVLAVSNELLFEVVAAAPTLGAGDTDGDGWSDAIESYRDSDGDGIPDYLDPRNIVQGSVESGPPLNALQQLPLQHNSYVMRTDPGLALRLGDIAFAAGNGSARVSVADIANFGNGEGGSVADSIDELAPNVGGYFDFEITNLPIAGSSANVVIPQFEPLPVGARYRKYHPEHGWNDFAVDDHNLLSSAAGLPGHCPLPGDPVYTAGLTAGDFCVQLTIQDGGPNDTDDKVNHVIEDPGQIVAVEAGDPGEPDPNEPPPVITETPAAGGGGIINLAIILGLSLFIWFTQGVPGRTYRPIRRA